MKKLKLILLCVLTVGVLISKTEGQELQMFGPGVHQDLDHIIQTRNICVPNPTTDVEYNFQKSFSDNVNDAIKRERTVFKNTKIGNYEHPQYSTDPVDYAHKIIIALRRAYSAAYDIENIDVPLDISVTNAAQNHSCKMISCNQFTHQSTCTGSPKSRLSAQVGDWGSCLMGYSENIAINTSKSVEAAIEWAIFGMMYDDLACCRNGHRENFLKCTYDENWRMGFGYQKGKYSFGSNRSYDAWFMTWDFAKKGRSSECGWAEDQGAKSCPASAVVTFQNMKVDGEGNCSELEVTWENTNIDQISNLEVFLSVDGKPYTHSGTIMPNSGDSHAVSLKAHGKEARIYAKANTKNGGFYSSEILEFDLGECKPKTEDGSPMDDEVTTPDVTDKVPEPKPESNPEVESDDLGISPNPARTSIRVTGVPSGTIYRIYTMEGRLAKIGIYRGQNIQLSRLQAGNYVLKAGGKTGKFVKL